MSSEVPAESSAGRRRPDAADAADAAASEDAQSAGDTSPQAREPQRDPPPLVLRREDEIRGDWFYWICFNASRLIGWIFWRGRVTGRENVPKSGRAIIAANHQSFLDPWLVGQTLVGRRPSFLARATLLSKPILGEVLRRLDTVPISSESSSPRGSLELCLRILERDRLLVYFPEGTRSHDGKLKPLKRGISLVAGRSKAPVIPAVLDGAYRVWPRHRRFPRLGRVNITFGKPIHKEEGESHSEFIERLSRTLRELAKECGAREVLEEDSAGLIRTEDATNAAKSDTASESTEDLHGS